MKMFKKIVAAALAAMMVLAMLTACGGTGVTQEERAINALNEARQQQGYSVLRHSEEADYYAQLAADVVAKYNDNGGTINKDGALAEIDRVCSIPVEGEVYKAARVIWNPDSVSATDLRNQYIAQVDATIVGVGTGTTCNVPFSVIVVY